MTINANSLYFFILELEEKLNKTTKDLIEAEDKLNEAVKVYEGYTDEEYHANADAIEEAYEKVWKRYHDLQDLQDALEEAIDHAKKLEKQLSFIEKEGLN